MSILQSDGFANCYFFFLVMQEAFFAFSFQFTANYNGGSNKSQRYHKTEHINKTQSFPISTKPITNKKIKVRYIVLKIELNNE